MTGGVSPKRNNDGTSAAPPLTRRRPQVKVLELTHIEREYELVHARLKMVKSQPDVSSSGKRTTPSNSATLGGIWSSSGNLHWEILFAVIV